MVDFDLDPGDRAVAQTAARFARERLLPIAATCDREERIPTELFAEAHALGILSATVPAELGGPGLGPLASSVVAEELGWACTGLQAALYCNHLTVAALVLAGTSAQKSRWLGLLAQAPHLASFCVTEPQGGSDLQALRTRARREGTGWVLEGEKAFITHAAQATFFVVLATVAQGRGRDGLAAFLVPGDAAGIVRLRPEPRLGQRASQTAGVRFDGVRLDSEALLAEEGKGFVLAAQVFDMTRPEVAGAATGLIQRCLDEGQQYARQRTSFQRPLLRHPPVRDKLVQMFDLSESSRLLYRKAAWLVECGRTTSNLSSLAKLHATEGAVRAALDVVQIFGAMGLCRDAPVEKLLRDAKVMEIYEGTSEIQRVRIGRSLT